MPPPGTSPAVTPAQKYKAFIDGFLPTLASSAHESRIAYMYLDSRAHLTIGIGHLLAKHEHRNDRAYVQAAIQAIFGYGFVMLAAPRPPQHGHKGPAVQPGPKGAPKPPPPPPAPSWWDNVTSSAENWWHHLTGPGPRRGPVVIIPIPERTTAPAAHPSTPGITVEKLTDDALKIMALDIHYTKTVGKKHPKVTKHIYGASHYRSYNRFALSESGIDRLGFDDVLAKISEVKGVRAFRNFDAFPEAAKQGVIDLAFQYGAGGLSKYTAFANAVAAADWATASAQVPAGTAGPTRTAWRRNQLAAAAPKPK